MRALILLFFVFIFSDVRNNYGMQRLISFSKKRLESPLLQYVAFNYYGISAILSHAIGQVISLNDTKRLCLLNESPEHQAAIQDLVNTYAAGDKRIKIYAPSSESSNEITDMEERIDEKTGMIIIRYKKLNPDGSQAYAGQIMFDPLYANGRALLNKKIIVHGPVEYALTHKNFQLCVVAQATVGHEIGHILNYDPEKIFLFALTAPLATYFFTQKILGKMNVKNKFTLISAIIAKNITDALLCNKFSRYRERQADMHVLTHAKDPAVLYSKAAWYQKLVQNEEQPNFMQQLFSTHPSSSERAAYFKKAAENFSKK